MLTDKPGIVITRAPRWTRKPSPKPAKPVAVIVGRKVAPAPPEGERNHAPAKAAERLWRELVRRVEANGRGNRAKG